MSFLAETGIPFNDECCSHSSVSVTASVSDEVFDENDLATLENLHCLMQMHDSDNDDKFPLKRK